MIVATVGAQHAAALSRLNSKFEYRNSKQFPKFEIRHLNSNPKRICLEHWVLFHYVLFRVSDFVLRIYLFDPLVLPLRLCRG